MAFASLSIGAGLLALHFYYNDYAFFDRWGWSSKLTDRLVYNFSRTEWLDGIRAWMAIFFFFV